MAESSVLDIQRGLERRRSAHSQPTTDSKQGSLLSTATKSLHFPNEGMASVSGPWGATVGKIYNNEVAEVRRWGRFITR